MDSSGIGRQDKSHPRHLGREMEAHADRSAEQQSREKGPVAESKGFEPANSEPATKKTAVFLSPPRGDWI